MVQVTQTDNEIKITIELNRLITRKPDIVLLPSYIKFNNPPIYFERHLMHEIDEMASFCRIFKTEARLVLIKKQKGMWPNIFQKLTKEELLKKRLEISDKIVERNNERDQQAMDRYEQKRRSEIDKEIRRETAMRERIKQFEESACRDAFMVGVRKETHVKDKAVFNNGSSRNGHALSSLSVTNAPLSGGYPVAAVRSNGKINVYFSNFDLHTPKRESQEGKTKPFKITDKMDI